MYNLVGIDGNAFAVMGYVISAMKVEKFTKEEISNYMDDAKSADYNHLLSMSIDMIYKCNERLSERMENESLDILDEACYFND